MKPHKLLILLFAIPIAIAACDSQSPCEARPTRMVTEADGTQICMEADNEQCDDDPCDADDDAPKVKTSKAGTKPKKKA